MCVTWFFRQGHSVHTHTPPPPPSFYWIFQKGVLTGSQFLRKVAGKEGVTILRGLQFLPKNCLRMKNVNIVGDSRNILTFRGGWGGSQKTNISTAGKDWSMVSYHQSSVFDRPYLSCNDHCDWWLFSEIFFY